jgi:hypothetical protein
MIDQLGGVFRIGRLTVATLLHSMAERSSWRPQSGLSAACGPPRERGGSVKTGGRAGRLRHVSVRCSYFTIEKLSVCGFELCPAALIALITSA